MTRQTTKPLIVLAFSVSPWRDQRTSPCSARPSRPLPCSPRTPPSPSSSSPRLSMRKMRPTDLTSLSRWRREPDRSTWRTWRVTTPPRPPSTLAQSSVSTCRLPPLAVMKCKQNKIRQAGPGNISHLISVSLNIWQYFDIQLSLLQRRRWQYGRGSLLTPVCGELLAGQWWWRTAAPTLRQSPSSPSPATPSSSSRTTRTGICCSSALASKLVWCEMW